MNLAAFRIQYPEFRSAADAFVQVFLDSADLQLHATYWGTYRDQAHGLLTAHLISMSPSGQQARLQTDKGNTTYKQRLDAMRDEITFADRVF